MEGSIYRNRMDAGDSGGGGIWTFLHVLGEYDRGEMWELICVPPCIHTKD